MGYEIHIERIDKDNKITVQEWIKYINNASDFEKIDELKAVNPITGLIVEMPCP